MAYCSATATHKANPPKEVSDTRCNVSLCLTSIQLYDRIGHRMLKGVSKSISKPLSILMNRSFNEGIFPEAWKVANVMPIFKKGDKSLPSNYRPVALLSCLGKLQERIVFKNLYNFLIDNNLLTTSQDFFLTILQFSN